MTRGFNNKMTEDNKPQDGAAPQGGDTQVFETLKHPTNDTANYADRKAARPIFSELEQD